MSKDKESSNFEQELTHYLVSDEYKKDIELGKKFKLSKKTVQFLDDVFSGRYKRDEQIKLILKKVGKASIKRSNIEAKLRAVEFFSNDGIINSDTATDSRIGECVELLTSTFKRGVNFGRADVRKKLKANVERKKRKVKRGKKK